MLPMISRYKQLTSEQRYVIYLGKKNGAIQSEIAKSIGVSPSTVSREIRRNKNKQGGYSWRFAHELAQERKERLPGNRSIPEWVKQKVFRLIRDEEWSPEQISGYLDRYKRICVSHETIYKWIRADKEAGGNLYKHCRHRLKHRKRPVGASKGIPNRKSIRERPVEADGSRFGDFEMDTMIGSAQSEVMLTITERKTNFIMAKKLPMGKDSKELAKSVITMLLPYKDKLKTITTDNGTEFAAHEKITEGLGVPIYFADPYSSWQKGAIENANKLIRQYIPKGTSFKDYPPEKIKRIQHKLNRRPRKKLRFSSPKIEFYKQFH